MKLLEFLKLFLFEYLFLEVIFIILKQKDQILEDVISNMKIDFIQP